MSENSLLTDGRDPGVTQSNPGKVALDGPLLNGLKEKPRNILVKKTQGGASLVAQWLRVCLPMQGTRVRALVWEDPTCHGATGPVSHNY